MIDNRGSNSLAHYTRGFTLSNEEQERTRVQPKENAPDPRRQQSYVAVPSFS